MAHKDIFRYFHENQAGHSKSSAYLLALLSLYVYDPPRNGTFSLAFRLFFQDLSDTDPFEVVTFAEPGPFPYDTQAAVLSNSRLVLVVFRGTEGPTALRDWITNSKHLMRACPKDWGAVKVHKGFYGALSPAYQGIRDEVRNRRQNNQKVFVTGHSLGGALATLCAYRFQKVGSVPVSGVYVFGSPRLGDIGFANEYNDLLKGKTFRWVKNLDFASKLPVYAGPAPLPSMQYHHVGQLNFIAQNGQVEMDAVDSNPGVGYNTFDHDMRNYAIYMSSRLSSTTRQSSTNPDYLVRQDVPVGGLF